MLGDKVICIDNIHPQLKFVLPFTIGKQYTILGEGTGYYSLTNDSGFIRYCDEDLFVKLVEHRLCVINEILK